MPRITYTQDEKENALRLCDEIGVLKASEQTGISTNSLYKWRTGVEAEAKSAADVGEAPVDGVVVEVPLADQAPVEVPSVNKASAHGASVGEVAGEADINLSIENKNSGRRYTAQEKEAAVRLCDAIGITKASKQTGITINSLRKWRLDAKEEKPVTTPVEVVPAEKSVTEQKDAWVDNEIASTDILARLSRTPVEEAPVEEMAAEEAEQPIVPEKTAGNESANEELIRLQVENETLRAQIAALKNALRVFTE